MKKFLVALFVAMFATSGYCADTKVSDLTELGEAPAASDELYINDGGTSKKIQYSNLISGLQTTLTNSSGLAGALSDETGSGAAVFGTSPTIATPVITGKVDMNDVAVDDDDCTGDQGKYWYDTTDSRFEFCDENSGTPETIDTVNSISGIDTYGCFYDGTNVVCNDAGFKYSKAADSATLKGGVFVSDGTDKSITFMTVDRASTDGQMGWDEVNDRFTLNYPLYISGSSGSVFLPEQAAADADEAGYGQIWVKNNSPNVLMFTDDTGNNRQLTATTDSVSVIYENLAAADDNRSLGSSSKSRTIQRIWCHCIGTCTTKADLSFEDFSGNALTLSSTPGCATGGSIATTSTVTAGGLISAFEGWRFDVTNTPSPETDTYIIGWDELEN